MIAFAFSTASANLQKNVNHRCQWLIISQAKGCVGYFPGVSDSHFVTLHLITHFITIFFVGQWKYWGVLLNAVAQQTEKVFRTVIFHSMNLLSHVKEGCIKLSFINWLNLCSKTVSRRAEMVQ